MFFDGGKFTKKICSFSVICGMMINSTTMEWVQIKGKERNEAVKKKWIALALVLAMALSLSGCLFRSPEDLYRQPEKSAGYEKLNEAIRKVRTALELSYGVAVEDAGIVSGDNTASIQLQDLDGDGSRESAVTFLRVPGVTKPLKILIFTQMGEEYQVTGMVEGEGTVVYSIEYQQLNDTGRKELVVNWQISTGAYQLGVYTLDELLLPGTDEGQMIKTDSTQTDFSRLVGSELLLTWCSVASDGSNGARLTDINQDTLTELAVIRVDSTGMNSYVELFGWRDGAMTSLGTVNLSKGITELSRVRLNYLSGQPEPPALYITSTLANGGKAIDVVACVDGHLTDLTLDESGISREILQGYTEVTPTDINGDYILEIPTPNALPSYGENYSTDFWLIDWCQYDEHGHRNHVMTTYHNVSDGWYLEIPESWRGQITISRNDQVTGQREVIVSRWMGEDEEPEPFLSIYRISSSQGNRVAENGWFLLREEESVIYAAQFKGSWDCGLNEQELRDRVKSIQTSWYYD